MATVIDLGCHDHGHPECDSLGALTRKYRPSRFYGFDPHPDFKEATFATDGTSLILRRRAAWLYDGHVGFHANGTGSRVGYGDTVPCFDFSAWLPTIVHDRTVVKMDIEGAEYDLLEKMVEDGTSHAFSELVIEWHGNDPRKDRLLGVLKCEVNDWWL